LTKLVQQQKIKIGRIDVGTKQLPACRLSTRWHAYDVITRSQVITAHEFSNTVFMPF